MKKNLLLIFLLLNHIPEASACDICGCGVGNAYIGVLPEFKKHMIGIRYRSNAIITNLGVGGSSTYLTNKENYQTAEVWGGIKFTDKLRLIYSIPYNWNSRTNNNITNSKDGIGDIYNTIFYSVLNRKKTNEKKQIIVQSLWIGAGVKLPTGEYNSTDKNTTTSNNLFQLGTGSTDFIISTMYDFRIQDFGININGNYKMNNSNKYNYKYGNKTSISSQLYYKLKIGKTLSVAPNTGILYEYSEKDIDNKEVLNISGGNLLMNSLGIETSYKRMAIGFNWQTPISQNIASAVIRANDKIMVHLSFTL